MSESPATVPNTSVGEGMFVASDIQETATARISRAPPASLGVAAFRDNIELSWLLHHYLHRPILREAISLSARNGLGEAAMAAAKVMSINMFAKFHKLLQVEGGTSTSQTPFCREYDHAISALQRQISSFHSEAWEEIVVPALLLFITEFWLTGRSEVHYAGLEQLLRISGQSSRHPNHIQLLCEARLAMVWYALSRGERTMFVEQPWRVAYSTFPQSPQNRSDDLVDCMAEISGLFAEAREHRLTLEEDSPVKPVYRARAQDILHRLYSWRWSWEARNRIAVSQQIVHDNDVFHTVLHFSEPALIYEIWLYDALLIFILKFLGKSTPWSQHEEPVRPTGGLILPDQVLSAELPAIEICRGLHYQLLNLSTPAPVHQWALPLALAYVTLPPESCIAAWVLSRIEAAPQRFSVPWSLYIRRLQSEDPEHSWGTVLKNTVGLT